MSENHDMAKNQFDGDWDKFANLKTVLLEAQRVGALSTAPIDKVISHALWFAKAIPADATEIVDLGSGAGVPGLVIAIARPELQVLLVDRRSGRTDALERSISVLKLVPRVTVLCAEISSMIRDPQWMRKFDAAISRGLGPHMQTLTMSRDLVKHGGVIVVSEPPASAGSRWDASEISKLELKGPERVGAVAMFHVEHL